jgi:DNA-binding CsgD family transcriptional regulator/tetratricopeptide (TPR) repeat protein
VLFGRERECRQVEALVDEARASRSAALLVRGEPGIGKSALLQYAVKRADGMRVLAGTGVEAESELPFAGLHQLLWPVLDHADQLPGVQAAALRAAFGLSDETVPDRFLVSVAVLGLLTAVAEHEPLLCLVDDAQWLDGASADALVFVARRLEADAVAIVLAVREGAARRLDAAGLPELRLEGLAPADAAALLDDAGPLPPAVRDELVRAASGNPLALLELPGALTEDERAGRAPLRLELPLTEHIEEAFLARVRPLDDDVRRVLLLAAADDSGDVATVLRAADALGLPARALDAAEAADLVRTEGVAVRFRHPLVRSALYRAAPFTERRAAHLALAGALSGEADADRAAWHRAVVAAAPDDEVADALARTAHRARERGGYLAAARALERAAELDSDPRSATDRLLAAAAAAAHAGRSAHAEALLARAEPGVVDPERRAAAALVRGNVELAVGRPGEGHVVLADAARAVLPDDPATGLELLAIACVCATLSGELDGMRDVCALGAGVEPDPDDAGQMFLGRLLSGLASVMAGDVAAGAPLVEEALTIADSLPDPQSVALAGLGAVYLGDWARALRYRDRAIRLTRERGEIGRLPFILGARAIAALAEGRLGEAVGDADEALRLADDVGAVNYRSLPLASLAWVAGLRGDEDECRRRAEEVLGLSLEHGLAGAAAWATWSLAQLDIGRGRWGDALERLLAVETRPFGVPVHSAWDRVEAAVHAERPDIAERAIASLDAWAQSAHPPWLGAVLADCRGLTAGGPGDADAHFEAAVEALDAARPLDRARIRLHYGEHLRRERRRADARHQLRAAFDGFDALGATPWAERARRELRATGETARKRDVSPLAELTPQELQVARMVADGATNKAVAAQLYVSPRTVEYHLRKVFTKLGIASRSDLMRFELGEDVTAPPAATAP